ncbi:E3 ubiquitin-protein ligase rnf8-B-like [Limulus polyphemus]|uniref:E3 ubiquitin-protein ligase rnf8-B-like n=1 Tax=Limulus polyphemus TaxID=6850 RepID=A0ABM1BFB1_LIMPO|nr:E3 ubiquitin-protein ligase rnf8-B-like [Limulus polyphemus]
MLLKYTDVISFGPPDRAEYVYCYKRGGACASNDQNPQPCKVRIKEKSPEQKDIQREVTGLVGLNTSSIEVSPTPSAGPCSKEDRNNEQENPFELTKNQVYSSSDKLNSAQNIDHNSLKESDISSLCTENKCRRSETVVNSVSLDYQPKQVDQKINKEYKNAPTSTVLLEKSVELTGVRECECVSKEQETLQKKLEELEQLLKKQNEIRKDLEQQLQTTEQQLQRKLKKKQEKVIEEREQLEEGLKKNAKERLSTNEKQLEEELAVQQKVLLDERDYSEKILAEHLEEKDKDVQERLKKEHEMVQKELAEKEVKTQLLEKQLQELRSEQEKAKKDVQNQFSDLVENELMCSICSELFVEATTLQCSHTFCRSCIEEWKKKKKECPICRTRIVSQTKALVVDSFIDSMVTKLNPQLQERRNTILKEREAKKKGKTQQSTAGETALPVGAHSVIVITDSDSDSDSDSLGSDSDASVSGDSWAYYGGYGHCFNCGRRGHWANGCPYY